MAKQSIVDVGFWKDEYILNSTPEEKLLFIYLFTNEKVNICGIYQISIKSISVDLWIERDMISNILEKFEADGKIKYSDGFVAIRNFIKYHTKSGNVQIWINLELARMPKDLVDFINLWNSIPLYRKKRSRISEHRKSMVMEKCKNKCIKCGEKDYLKLQIDHKIPLSLWWDDDIDNLQILCKSCKYKKRHKVL